ncbi:MAG: hypothetical protein ABI591_03765 [Kofleriaceae bacterium]
MLRLLLVLPLAACSGIQTDTPPIGDPDAASCDLGAFEVAAPHEGLHYDKSLDVLVDETELWAELTVTIGDDGDDSFLPTSDTTAPYAGDASWWNLDTFHFELAANTRYTLTVSHCNMIQRVAFFTN